MPLLVTSILVISLSHGSDIPRIAIRAFKSERILEVWGAKSESQPFRLIASYPIAAVSGTLGPKRRDGDMQAPEGFYCINRFNPHSQFHLSLGLNYPNSSDRILGDRKHLGKDIFIHGNHVSAGCLAMTDPVIDVIYGLANHAKAKGQRAIPVSIFPFRMDHSNWIRMKAENAKNLPLVAFWETLRPGFLTFERTHRWPRPHVDKMGRYVWPELTE